MLTKKTVLITLAIMIPLAIAGRWIRREERRAQTQEVVRLVAKVVHPLYLQKNPPTREEINRAVFGIQTAGVTNLQVGPDGRPADPYRTPLIIHHEVRGKQAITTVTSAGADREFATPDDVVYSETTEISGKP